MSAASSLAAQIALIEKKRAVLLGLTQLVISLERLHASLEAVLLLGGNRQQLSEAELRSVEVIRQRVSNLSDAELRAAVFNLDGLVSDSLLNLSRLALQLVDDPQVRLDQLESIHPQVNTFNRNARTAIALRALLAKRGEVVVALHLPLPRLAIQQRLQQVDAREQVIRQQVCSHITGMRADVAQLLTHPACSDAQRAMYQALDQSLAENLAHIQAGHSLSELPVAIENIEVAETAPVRNEDSREAALPAAPVPPVTREAPLKEEAGLLPRVRDWLNAPWNSGRKRD